MTEVKTQPTIVTLKEYFDKQLELYKENQESKIQAVIETAIVRHEALAEATRIKSETLEKRFDNTNEWRNTVIDILAKAATKEDLENVYKKIDEFEEFKNSRLEVPGDIKALFASVKDINDWKMRQEGKASQSSVIWAFVVSAVTFIISLITLLEKFTK